MTAPLSEMIKQYDDVLPQMFHMAAVGMCLIDDQRQFTLVNQEFAAIFGYRPEDMVGLDCEMVFGDAACETAGRGCGTGAGSPREIEVMTRDGTQRIVLSSGSRIVNPAGRPFLLVIAQDVTGRRRAEDALRESEQRARHIVDSITDGFVTMDREWRITYLNPRAEELVAPLNKRSAHLIGKVLWDEFPDLLDTVTEVQYRRAVREQVPVAFEMFYPPLDGWYDVRAYPSKDGLSVYLLDITDRKRTEAELQSIAWLLHQGQASFTVPEAPSYGHVTDLNKDGTILSLVGTALLERLAGDYLTLLDSSAAVYEQNGDYALGISSSNWCRFMDETSRRSCGTDDNRLAMAGGQWHCHESCWSASRRSMETGQPVDMPCLGGLRLYAVPIQVDGETVGSLNFGYGDPPQSEEQLAEVAERYGVEVAQLRDLRGKVQSRPQFIVEVAKTRLQNNAVLLGEIIKRRRTENQLRQVTGELERRIRERTEELTRTHRQLRAFATELNLAEQRERKRLAGELHDHLAQLLVLARLKVSQMKKRGGPVAHPDELLQQIEEVLNESLSYTRTLVADLSPTVLHEYGLSPGLRWLSEQMRRYKLEVSIDCAGTESIALPEDRAVLLFQCVRELLINASKHARSERARVVVCQRDGELRIEVRDDGIGFDVAAASASSETAPLSSKFGLFSIRERLGGLGGSFELLSAPGRGTTATLVLPLTVSDVKEQAMESGRTSGAVQPEACHAGTSSAPRRSGRQGMIRVVLVDDHAMMRQGLRSVLDGYAGVEVVGEAQNGEEAVEAVERLQPSVVVMDINMPKMNGIEATTLIKARHPDITVIGLSVNVGAESQAAMKAAGATTLLTKEAAVEQLYTVIGTRSGLS